MLFLFFAFTFLLIGMPSGAAADVIRVPADTPTLTSALGLVQEGDTIELAGGVYESPGVDGFQISDENLNFTIRAASGAAVTLSGGGSKRILRLRNLGTGNYAVTFEGLTFADGFTNVDGPAAGVTVNNGNATFVDCEFIDNTTQASTTGGGGMLVTQGATVHIFRSRFEGNTARTEAGGIRVSSGSTLHVHDSEFIDNRVDVPNHRNSAAGGGIHMSNSVLNIADSRFEGNAAGCVGGAVYSLGTWADPIEIPAAEVTIVNSTFENNLVEPDPAVGCLFAPVGAGVHSEDHVTAKIYHSRFINNNADIGGAVSQYRTILEIYDSVFQGNRANAPAVTNFGGAIMSNSNDIADASTGSGAINRRSSQLTIHDSFFQARFETVSDGGFEGGCLFATGDTNRRFGIGGVSQNGTAAQNRTTIDIERSVFYDCDVIEGTGVAGTGTGGALAVDFVDLEISDSLFIGNDAFGSGGNGSGGAIKLATDSDAFITRSTFAKNTAFSRGGAIQVSGSRIDVEDSQFFDNEVTGGNGSAIWSAVFANFFGSDLSVQGLVRRNVFSNNITRELVEVDNTNGPINNLQYNDNDFFTTNGTVYSNNLIGPPVDVAGLNSVVVTRSGASNTDKATAFNANLGSQPRLGALVAAPPEILLNHAAGDPPAPGQSFLGYAWSGPSGTQGELFGSALPDCVGFATSGAGVQTLEVGPETETATLTNAPIPASTFNASPSMISSGQSSTLNWSVTGTLVDLTLDRALGITSASASGNQSVSPGGTTTYRLCALTQQGGAVGETTVFVDEFPPIFADGFESGNLTAWTTSVP